jgi:prevent-host-death family protein
VTEINATEFKAKCLALLDEVYETGSLVVISKRGKPIAQLVRYADTEPGPAQLALRGTAHINGDIERPAVSPGVWGAQQDR